jgi:hypothetical protein
MGRFSRRHKNNFVQRKLQDDFLGDDQMAGMDRVERAAENADPM